METINWEEIEAAKKGAIEVLLHNAHGPFHGLPRTAGWGYPEPYTRDLMFSIFGIAVSGNQKLIDSIRKVLQTLAKNQTKHGQTTNPPFKAKHHLWIIHRNKMHRRARRALLMKKNC